MKIKSLVSGILIVLGLVFVAPPANSYAADVLADCTIVAVVQNTAVSRVRLTDTGGAFTDKNFAIAAGKENQMLAIFLTALSLEKEVRIAYDDTNDTITRVQVLQ